MFTQVHFIFDSIIFVFHLIYVSDWSELSRYHHIIIFWVVLEIFLVLFSETKIVWKRQLLLFSDCCKQSWDGCNPNYNYYLICWNQFSSFFAVFSWKYKINSHACLIIALTSYPVKVNSNLKFLNFFSYFRSFGDIAT